MNRHIRVVPLRAAMALALLAFAGAAAAETLLIERVQEESKAAMPARGMSMADVEARFGQKGQWPTINRWSYPAFVVYFEKNKVIDAVAIQADATETGPKPPIR